jgi:hypothetical protein
MSGPVFPDQEAPAGWGLSRLLAQLGRAPVASAGTPAETAAARRLRAEHEAYWVMGLDFEDLSD